MEENLLSILIVEAKACALSNQYFQGILVPQGLIVALLAEKNNVVVAVTLDCVRELQSIERWYRLELREFFCRATDSTDVCPLL